MLCKSIFDYIIKTRGSDSTKSISLKSRFFSHSRKSNFIKIKKLERKSMDKATEMLSSWDSSLKIFVHKIVTMKNN